MNTTLLLSKNIFCTRKTVKLQHGHVVALLVPPSLEGSFKGMALGLCFQGNCFCVFPINFIVNTGCKFFLCKCESTHLFPRTHIHITHS